MAAVNLFEGSRRIALVVKLAWSFGAILIAWNATPYVSLHFSTDFPDHAFVKTAGACDSADAYEFLASEIASGKSASVTLCFRTLRADGGETVIPFRTDATGRWWGNSKYSTDVTAYTKARASRFVMNDADRQAALAEWDRARRDNLLNGVYFAAGGWLVLSILQFVLGWVVRGFLGIPHGQDRRPERKRPDVSL